MSGLNSPGNDIQPNVRKDGREIVFSSDHPYPGAHGSQDVCVSVRASVDDPWSAPQNLGDAGHLRQRAVTPATALKRAWTRLMRAQMPCSRLNQEFHPGSSAVVQLASSTASLSAV